MAKFSRPMAAFGAMALGLSGAIVGGAPTAAHAAGCVPTDSVHVLSFNDFHGRIESATKIFTPVEQLRAQVGEDHVLLTSNGDSIGGSTFVSAVAQDFPTLDVLKHIELDASSTGNHEYDYSWSDLSERVIPYTESVFPHLSANVYKKGTDEVAAPLKAYEVFEKGGVRIAVIGAVTKDLPSLVSPGGISNLTIGDPVAAINKVAKEIDAADKADVIVAQIHEGAANGSDTAEDNAAKSLAFADIYRNIDESVDVIFNGHTHQSYDYRSTKGQPILQAKSYGSEIRAAKLNVSDAGELCSVDTSSIGQTEADTSFPRIAQIDQTVAEAKERAAELGAEVIGSATVAISTPGSGGSGTRDEESPMNNAVAQMFYDKMNDGNPEFIGVQNPGGTRTSFDAGDITYEEAALVLPFANSLWTTQLTGAQFKTILEQQWQRDADGNVPSRPYLALGLSKNVSYTLDETRPEGERITGIFVNGKPIDEQKLYTFGSGSFLISGGDNFREFASGQNARDYGLVDLTAFVDWVKGKKTLSPDYSKRGTAMQNMPAEIKAGSSATVDLGVPGEIYKGTLDMFLDESGERVSPRQPNTTVEAYLGDTKIGSGAVENGSAKVKLTIPANARGGAQAVRFDVKPAGTVIWADVNIAAVAPLSATAATVSGVGVASQAWGNVDGPALVYTQVKLSNGNWSTSQKRSVAGGFYSIPLTYGRHMAGTLEWRVAAKHPSGLVEVSQPFTQKRVAAPTLNTAGVKGIKSSTYAWGYAAGAKPGQQIWTQVKLPTGKWSTSQRSTVKANGTYVIELTYGKGKAGTYEWRVATQHDGFVTQYSPVKTLTRR